MSYWNQPISWGWGSTFTSWSGAPTGATPVSPPFYRDDTNNQFYAYNGSAREAETDRTVWSWAPTWATPTNPPFYWDDVANKLYLYNGTVRETEASSWGSWAPTWWDSFNIDLMSYAIESVWWVNGRSLDFWITWLYYIYAKALIWTTTWGTSVNIYRNVSWTLTLLDSMILYNNSTTGVTHEKSLQSKVLSISAWDTIHIEFTWQGTLEELKVLFWPQRPDPVISYLTDFKSTTYWFGNSVSAGQSPNWNTLSEQPFNPTISYDPTTPRYATTWPASNELTMSVSWTFDITVTIYWLCDFPWIWWFPAWNRYSLFVNNIFNQNVWVWSNTWFFCIDNSTVTFPSVVLSSWDIIKITKTQWTIWYLWTFSNNIYINKI